MIGIEAVRRSDEVMKVIDPMISGLMDPEGPVALDDGRWLVVEMHLDRGCVTMIDPTPHSLSLKKRTGRPNGLALAANRDVLVAESSKPALLRLTMDGESRTLLTGPVAYFEAAIRR